MKNDQVYIVNGLRAVFRAKTERGIISTYPIAEFTFDDGEKITVKFIPLTGKYSFNLLQQVVIFSVGFLTTSVKSTKIQKSLRCIKIKSMFHLRIIFR